MPTDLPAWFLLSSASSHDVLATSGWEQFPVPVSGVVIWQVLWSCEFFFMLHARIVHLDTLTGHHYP